MRDGAGRAGGVRLPGECASQSKGDGNRGGDNKVAHHPAFSLVARLITVAFLGLNRPYTSRLTQSAHIPEIAEPGGAIVSLLDLPRNK